MTRQSSTSLRAAPPSLPSSAPTPTPLARAACAARSTLGLPPLVECSTPRAPRARSSPPALAPPASPPGPRIAYRTNKRRQFRVRGFDRRADHDEVRPRRARLLRLLRTPDSAPHEQRQLPHRVAAHPDHL